MASPFDNKVFLAFTTYAIITILKLMFMGPLTVLIKITGKASEDPHNAKNVKKGQQVNEYLELVRSCHQNDMENIIPFVVIGLLYVLTGPDLPTALLFFRLFVGSRFVHTVAYMMGLPHPVRGIAYILGTSINFYMAVHVLITVLML